MRVVVTASRGRLEGLERHLATLGHDAVRAPLVAVRPRDDAAARAAAEALRPLRWWLFPSRSAVAAWAGLGLGFRDGARIGAVGPATAAEVRAHGGRVAVVADPATAAGLAAAVLAHPDGPRPGEPVAVVQGAAALPTLVDALAAAGRPPRVAVLYDRDALAWPDGAAPDAVVVASPSAVAALPDPVAARALLVAIGPTTAGAARARGARVVQAATPDVAGIAAALAGADDVTNARAGQPATREAA